MDVIGDAFGGMLGYLGTAGHDWGGYQRLPRNLTTDSLHPKLD